MYKNFYNANENDGSELMETLEKKTSDNEVFNDVICDHFWKILTWSNDQGERVESLPYNPYQTVYRKNFQDNEIEILVIKEAYNAISAYWKWI